MMECIHLWVRIDDAEGADEFTNYYTYWECEFCGKTTDDEPELNWEDDPS